MNQDEKLGLVSQLLSRDSNAMHVIKEAISDVGIDTLHKLFSDTDVQKDLLFGLMTGQLTDPEIISFISRVPVALNPQDSLNIWNANFTKLLDVLPTQPNVVGALYLLNADIPTEHQLPLAEASFNMPFVFGSDVATKSLLDKKEKFTNIDAQSLVTWKLKNVSEMSALEKAAFTKALCSNNPHAATVISYHLDSNGVDPSFRDFLRQKLVQEALLEGLMKGEVVVDIIPYLYRVPVLLSPEKSLAVWNKNFEHLLEILPTKPSAINALYLLGNDTRVPDDHQYPLAQALFGRPFQHTNLDDIVESGVASNLPKFTNPDAKALLACGLIECASLNYSRQLMHFFLPVWDIQDIEIENRNSSEFLNQMRNLGPKNISLNCSRLNGFRMLLIAIFLELNTSQLNLPHLKILKNVLGKGWLVNKDAFREKLAEIKRLSQNRQEELDAERAEACELLKHLPKEQRRLVSPLPKRTTQPKLNNNVSGENMAGCNVNLLTAFDDVERTSVFTNRALIGIGIAASVTALVAYAGYQWYSQTQENGPNMPDL